MARRSNGMNRLMAFLGPLLGMFVGYFFCLTTNENSRSSSAILPSLTKRFLSEEHHISMMEEKEYHGYHSFEEKGSVGSEEEEDISFTVSTAVVCIVLILILLTIGFEEMKESIEERANKNMEPIIDALFGEMTVLGFLSVFTFVVTRLGFFDNLSVLLFGEEEEELLEEIFEYVHYCLFFIMLFFVIQVLELVRDAMAVEEEWLEMDRRSIDKGYMTKCQKKCDIIHKMEYRSENETLQYLREFYNLLPFRRNKKIERVEDQIVFAKLREEFIHERSFEYPFRPSNKDNQVPHDFNFGRYLGMCMAHTLTHVVEVDVLCWVFFAIFTIIFYSIELLVDSNMVILGCIWVGFGWAGMLFIIHFEHHFFLIRNAFVPASALGLSSVASTLSLRSLAGDDSDKSLDLLVDEQSKLLIDDANLPEWTKVNMDEYMKKRNWMKRWINGPETPQPQHTLFWFERKGGKASVLILQLNLLGVGIYCALLLLAFLPAIYREYGYELFGIYLVLSAIPLIVITMNKKHLVAIMSQTLSIGALRKPQMIANVIREEKTARVVRSFLILYKMHRAAESGFRKQADMPQMPHFSIVFDDHQLTDLSNTFDGFDKSGDGNISSEEFGAIMESLGVPLDDEKLRNMVSVLDADGDGEVSKEEFLQWYADQQSIVDDLTTEERAHFLFSMFDADNSGEITVSEFKATIDAFNFGFTVDEVGDLIKELDEDGNGTLSVEEFEELLVKYHPKELPDDSLHSRHSQSNNSFNFSYQAAH